MHKHRNRILLLLYMIVCAAKPHPQKTKAQKIQISANLLKGSTSADGKKYNELIHNVKTTIDQITICTNYAIYSPEDKFLISKDGVRILHENGTVLEGDVLNYSLSSKIAALSGNVKITFEDTEFVADNITYNLSTQKGTFSSQGKLTNKENYIVCKHGVYDAKNRTLESNDGVELYNSDYYLYSDSMHYNDATKLVSCKGHTYLSGKDDEFKFDTYETAKYNTKDKIAKFINGTLNTKAFEVKAITIDANLDSGLYSINKGITINLKDHNMSFVGEEAIYNHKLRSAHMSKRPLLTKVLKGGNMYLRADEFTALQTAEDETGNRNIEIEAKNDIVLYKKGFQAKFDSMKYIDKDLIIYVVGAPVVWNYSNQITSDSAKIFLKGQGKEQGIDRVIMQSNACLAFREKKYYNQIKGNDITINFEKNNVKSICVDKNVEILYYVLVKKRLEGLNELKCGKLKLIVNKSHINLINLPLHAQGLFTPVMMMDKNKKQKFFDNFVWREAERPTEEMVLSSKEIS